jgi:hypothetical protein
VRSPDQPGLINNNNAAPQEKGNPMIFQIRADRDVTSKAPEGTGTRRRTITLSTGPLTLTFGSSPTYVDCDELPIEIRTDGHLLTKAVAPENLDIEITVINLKSERVQEDITAPPNKLKSSWVQGDDPIPELKSERVQGDDDTQELKSERVQEPNRKKR